MSQKIRLLLGGSPCTHWSIAQTKNRETEPSGIGWELFRNYLVALKKYRPDYFLYENNKSMAPAIRAQITKELGVEPVLINSATVSAQSRQRLYWFGKRNPDGTYSQVDVEQPEDRGILLRDILESGIAWQEKGYCLKAQYSHGIPDDDMLKRRQNNQVAEPVNITADGKAQCLRATYYKAGIRNLVANTVDRKTCVAEPVSVGAIERAAPVRVGDMPTKSGKITGSQNARIYDAYGKSATLTARPNGGGVDGPLYAVPAGMAWRGRGDGSAFEMRDDQKANAVIVGHQSRLVIDGPAIFQHPHGFNKGGVKYEKAPTLTANGDWAHNNMMIEVADGKTYPVYEVRNGIITIKGQQYPIKLADGYYIIRKLTVLECMRLQTVPEWYTFPVSDTQAYKMLGNGWTVDVIAHILSHIPGITRTPVEVLSMYDGMSCGHIALDKLGANVSRYYATEIDKYAIQTTMANYPDTVQLGDAFQVLADDWDGGGVIAAEPERKKLDIVPMTLREANAFVEQNHRHHGPVPGQKFSIGLSDGERIVGVAIVGRPVARHLDDGWTLEVNRLCTDGSRNACSMLYAAAWRAARAMGYKRLVTYILESENGASLRAAGWKCVGQAGGLRWTGERRPEVDLYPAQMKIRFERSHATT